MRIFLTILLLLLSIAGKTQVIPAENVIWQYGKGNSDLPIIFNGAWKSYKLPQNQYYQDYYLKIIKAQKDTALKSTVRFYQFDHHPLYACVKSQTNEIADWEGFIYFKDLPPGTYTFIFDDKLGYTNTENFVVDPSSTATTTQSTSYTYTNQLITIQ
jgi:hypothetical protein